MDIWFLLKVFAFFSVALITYYLPIVLIILFTYREQNIAGAILFLLKNNQSFDDSPLIQKAAFMTEKRLNKYFSIISPVLKEILFITIIIKLIALD